MNLIFSIKPVLTLLIFCFLITDLSAQELKVKKNANNEIMVEPLNTSQSSFFGENAGLQNTGSKNTFIGESAGRSNTTGKENTFLGLRAGFDNTTASNNTFLGSFAGYSNITGFDNTFIGRSAGFGNDIGFDNTFLGTNAGINNRSGSNNTFLGKLAGQKNTEGQFNTFVGKSAGEGIKGSNNTIIGYQAGALGTLNSGSVFIGNEAGKLETSDNRLYISNSDANADNALIYGEFDNKLLRFNTDTINIRSIGDAKIILEADSDNANESDNPQIEFSQDGGLVKTFLGYDQDVLGANIFGISSAKKDKILMVHEFGHVGINEYYNNTTLNVKAIATDNFVLNVEKADDANLFSVFPSGNAYLLGTLTQSSDRTLKKNIVKINNATESVQKLAGYRYNWISESSDQRTQIGVIAQELQAVYPELVSENEEGTLSVNYSGLSAVLIEAVKEQQDEIHAQEYKIDILMRKLESQALVVSELTAEMKSIRKTLGNNTVSVQSQK